MAGRRRDEKTTLEGLHGSSPGSLCIQISGFISGLCEDAVVTASTQSKTVVADERAGSNPNVRHPGISVSSGRSGRMSVDSSQG